MSKKRSLSSYPPFSWFSWVPFAFNRIYYGIISPFVPEGYVKQTKVYETLNWRVRTLENECTTLADENRYLQLEIERIGPDSDLEANVEYLQSQLEYQDSELVDMGYGMAKILRNWQELVQKHNVKGSTENLPTVEELAKNNKGRMKLVEILSTLHEKKNDIILHTKKSNAELTRRYEALTKQYEHYRIEIAEKLAAMEPKERLMTVFEHAEDSILILDNNYQVINVSKETAGILACRPDNLSYYTNKPFNFWFVNSPQYSKFESKMQELVNENKRTSEPFEFQVKAISSEMPRIVDATVVRIGYDSGTYNGYLVLLDKAKFFARMKAYAASLLKTKESTDVVGEIAPEAI